MSALDDRQAECLNPAGSVIVESCAGSGKTWLLTSRLMRILLAEPQLEPGRILAITFTNAAAAEIDERLAASIAQFEGAGDQQLDNLLTQIGAPRNEQTHTAARRLRRRFVLARPRLAARTFHGWFNQLCQDLPWAQRFSLTAQISGATGLLHDWAWRAGIETAAASGCEQPLQRLLDYHSPEDLHLMLQGLVEHRLAWELIFGVPPGDEQAPQRFMAKLDLMQPGQPQPEQMLASDAFAANIKALQDACAAVGGKAGYLDKFATALRGWSADNSAGCEQLWDAAFTRKGELSKNLAKKFAPYEEFTRLINDLQHCRQWRIWRRLRSYNDSVALLGRHYAQAYEQAKLVHGAVDYADLELNALRAMRDDAAAAGLVAAAEHDFAHILIDEFQDTSPTQWEIMRNWLNHAHGTDAPPTIFIVGDPKQSIYSFQGGDPQVMQVAGEYLQSKYQAKRVAFNTTRRCCQAVLDGVNALFGEDGQKMAGFVKHDTTQTGVRGRIIVAAKLPAAETPKPPERLRNPLTEPPAAAHSTAAEQEGEQLSELLDGIIANWGIADGTTVRPCAPEDVMLLFPRRRGAEDVIKMLRGAGHNCAQLGSENRLHSLECRDIIALLQAIYNPASALALAQVLRSPIFGLAEADLWAVFAAGQYRANGKTRCNWYRGLSRAAGSKRLDGARRLLSTWRRLYLHDKLPAHEMLARCYHDADLIKRYAAAVPRQICKRVVLNLQWMLNYAIEADGGHRVQLADYAHHLLLLSEQPRLDGDQPAPAGMIKTCTVHGAKGLESPVVIIVHSNAQERSGSKQLLLSWQNDPRSNTRLPAHFSFFPNQRLIMPEQRRLLEENRHEQRSEFLNMLYVAMTRTKQVLGMTVRPSKKNFRGLNWHSFATSALTALGAREHGGYLEYGDQPPAASAAPAAAAAAPAAEPPAPIAHGRPKPPPTKQQRDGTLVHELLTLQLTGITDPAQQRHWLGLSESEHDRLSAKARRMLAGKQLAGLLAASRRCELEVPVITAAGDQLRIDCLLDTGDAVWIIDFKSALQPDAGRYREQLGGYRAAVLSGGETRPVKTALVDGEGRLTEL